MQWIADKQAGTFSTTIHKTDSGNELVGKVVAKGLAAFKLQGIKSYCPHVEMWLSMCFLLAHRAASLNASA